jgi:hypothetical protein
MKLWEVSTVIFAWFIILGGLTWFATGSEITGLVPLQTQNEIVDQKITDTSSIPIDVQGRLRSLTIWAEIYGEGKAEVLLENVDGTRITVYSNAKPTGFSSITGLAANINDVMIIDGGCAETCRIPRAFAKGPYRIVIQVAPGTTLNLHRVSYS